MGQTLTDILLFGKAQSSDVNNGKFVIYRRNILRWSALGGYLDVIVKGVSPLVLPDAIANSLSYVKAFGGTEQRDIPDNYLQRQFIYMMDGSYLLTDIVPTYDCKIEMDFQTTSVPSGSMYLLGGRTETYGGLFFAKGSGVFLLDAFGNTLAERYVSSVAAADNTRYKLTYNNKVATLSSGGTTLFTNTSTGTQANGAALCINGRNDSGTVSGAQAGIYLYSFKVWNDQGELVMDLVPAVQKGTVPVVGFYDTVSGTFKTATAGTFAAGGEAVPTPDAPMDIVSNNGKLVVRDNELPVAYKRLKDIIFDGEVYYVTDIYLTGADTTSFVMNATESGRNALGCYTGNSSGDNISFYISIGSSGSYVRYKDGLYRPVLPSYQLNTDLSLSIGPTGTTGFYTDVTWVELEFACPNELYIGWLANATSAKFLGTFKGNITVSNRANFVPCERVSDGAIGYYNTYSETFFENQGTGTPTTSGYDYTHNTVVADGTVETIQATSKNLFAYTSLFDTYVTAITYHTFDIPNGTYTMSSPDFPVGQSNATNVFVFAGTATSGASSSTNGVTSTTPRTITVTDGKYTVAYRSYNSNNTNDPKDFRWQLELGSTATDYVPYYDGGTATTEMLLKVGNYQDVQSIIDGVVTRNVGVKVLDGTENWQASGSSAYQFLTTDMLSGNFQTGLCTHFNIISNVATFGIRLGAENARIYAYVTSQYATLSDWTTFLANQYNAGTPVIVIYPLATPTTESVAGQTLQVTGGDNILEITQASLNNLELEAKYQAAVSLTIQEVQDANLDPNVEVTIN